MISSVQNPTIIKTAKLHQKKYRDLEGLTLIEGKHLLEEAFKKNVVVNAYSLDETYTQVSPHVMKKLSGTHVPDYLAVIKKPAKRNISGSIVVCENIQDPGNLGTLMRSAAAFGFIDFMVIGGVDPYSPKVIKASEGAFFHVNIIEVDLAGALKRTSSSFRLMTHPHQEETKEVTTPLSIWLGNEGNGLSKEALSHADGLYQIKTKYVESLNVAVAGSIVMHQFKN